MTWRHKCILTGHKAVLSYVSGCNPGLDPQGLSRSLMLSRHRHQVHKMLCVHFQLWTHSYHTLRLAWPVYPFPVDRSTCEISWQPESQEVKLAYQQALKTSKVSLAHSPNLVPKISTTLHGLLFLWASTRGQSAGGNVCSLDTEV